MAKGRVSLAVTALRVVVALGVGSLFGGRTGRQRQGGWQGDSPSAEVARKEIEAFNVKFLGAHQRNGQCSDCGDVGGRRSESSAGDGGDCGKKRRLHKFIG